MKIGVCTGFENIQLAAECGFDFVEINLSALAAMPDEQFEQLAQNVPSFAIPVLRSNCFLPGDVHITGPDYDMNQQREYLEKALSRAKRVGIEVAVLGSSGARRVPEGWTYHQAWQQMASFLRMAGDCAQKYGIRIALEPLRHQECNILNLVSQAVLLCAWVDHPCVGVLGDTFHMLHGGEDWEMFKRAGDRLWHVHISRPLPDMSGRIYPAENDGVDYASIFQALRDAGYDGTVSIEAGCVDFAKEAPGAARRLIDSM